MKFSIGIFHIALIALFSASPVFTEVSLQLSNTFGYTAVDVAAAMEVEEATGGSDGLVDWDNFNYRGITQVYFGEASGFDYGAELGFHRLYYWEKKYTPFGFSPRWNWGTIWTWSLGGIVKKELAGGFNAISGFSVHTFFNGSGTTVGIPLGIQKNINLFPAFSIPLEFRTDVIFGSSVPIAIGGGISLLFNIQ